MCKAKHGLISFSFLMMVIASSFIAGRTNVYAATATPTVTATRIQHVTAGSRSTPTPPLQGTAPVTARATAISVPGGSIEATVQAYLEQPITDTHRLSTTVAVSPAQPVRLVIPTLQIDALIERVSQDQNGAMEIPGKVEQVAWYGLGAAPGEVGSAVIAGHLDLADGSPAVFWQIGKLKIGDEVLVYDAANVGYRFQVSGSQRYAYNQAPIEDIFGFSLKSELNLITCAGAWDRNSRNYASRLVVYTELVEVIPPD